MATGMDGTWEAGPGEGGITATGDANVTAGATGASKANGGKAAGGAV